MFKKYVYLFYKGSLQTTHLARDKLFLVSVSIIDTSLITGFDDSKNYKAYLIAIDVNHSFPLVSQIRDQTPINIA